MSPKNFQAVAATAACALLASINSAAYAEPLPEASSFAPGSDSITEPATAPPPLPSPLDAPVAGTTEQVPLPAPSAAPLAPIAGEESPPPAPAAVEVKPEEAPTPPATIATDDGSVPAPIPDPSSSDPASAVAESRAQRNSRIPRYTLSRPSWGVQVTGAAKALGGKDLLGSQAGNPTRALQFSVEYQFPYLQTIGVLSLGPSAGIYPIFPGGTVTSTVASLWDVGGQVRYQARFFREQPLVPVVGYEARYLTYRFKDGPAGALMTQGPFFGGMFLLNIIEPSSAAEFYINTGVSRSYLVAEVRTISGSDNNINFSGATYFFGLRLEL